MDRRRSPLALTPRLMITGSIINRGAGWESENRKQVRGIFPVQVCHSGADTNMHGGMTDERW